MSLFLTLVPLPFDFTHGHIVSLTVRGNLWHAVFDWSLAAVHWFLYFACAGAISGQALKASMNSSGVWAHPTFVRGVEYDGAMYSAQTASHLGLIDQVSADEKLVGDAREVARRLATKDAAAFRSIKGLFELRWQTKWQGRRNSLYGSLLTSGTPKTPGGISKP